MKEEGVAPLHIPPLGFNFILKEVLKLSKAAVKHGETERSLWQ